MQLKPFWSLLLRAWHLMKTEGTLLLPSTL